MKRGYQLMNDSEISMDDMMDVALLVHSPKLNMCRRDYSRDMASDYNSIFALNAIGGPSFMAQELIRLALVGKAFEDATNTRYDPRTKSAVSVTDSTRAGEA